jgi:phenylacetate-CoA ligase
MNAVDQLYGLYRRIPVPLQNVMVTAYGYQLHRRRYGKEHDEVLDQLMRSVRWEKTRLKALELERLQETLAYAYEHVPHYRELWKKIGFDPRDVRRIEDVRQLPVTEKDEVRADPWRFVSETFHGKKLYKGGTSGTTGKPVTTYKDRSCYQRTWAFQERQRQIWGITSTGPRVSIGVRPVVPMSQTRPPFWRHDLTEDNWHFSNFHIDERTLDAYVEKIAAIGPEEINAYPSGSYLVARHALRRGINSIRPKTVISCAETLYAEQRATLEAAFGCKIADQYGSAEVVFWVGQCPSGTYHISHEFGLLESVRGDTAVWDEPGDAVGTGFVNKVQVLIRYRLGDSVVLPRESSPCPCGMRTDVVSQIVGRTDDVLYAADGRALGRLDILMKKLDSILEAQLVQDERDHLLVNLVAVDEPDPAIEEEIRARVVNLFGAAMQVDFRWIDRIPRTAAGKFRYQLNLVGPPR